MRWHPDPDCAMCNGSGTIFCSEKIIGDEYWVAFVDCDCVEDRPKRQASPELQAVLAEALAAAGL